MKYKKSQGLPITVIIIAALGLTILVILLWATVGKVRFFSTGVEEEAKLKECVSPNVVRDVTECTEPLLGNYGWKKAGKLEPLPPDKVCCKK